MPKKRSYDNSEDIIERYRRKLRKLEENQRRKRRRILIESSSDSGEESSQDEQVFANAEPHMDGAASGAAAAVAAVSTALEEDNENLGPELDPEILSALGEPTNNTPKFGEKIHNSLAQRWDPILKKGLGKEEKEILMKKYLVPENCPLFQAPKLNEEVSAAISEAARHRDKRKELDQQQLGVGISAINNALTVMLTSEKKIEALKIFSDGCRILSDLHFSLTHSRKTIINYSLAKPFLNIVQDTERDDTLYGQKLAEKIKASKAIEKQGLSIKKVTKTQKSATNEQTGTSSRPYQQQPSTSFQGNWSGPSRFQQNRGGGAEGTFPQDILHPNESTTSAESAATAAVCSDVPETTTHTCDTQLTQKPSYPGSCSSLRQAFSSRGVPESALDITLSSLSKNTMQQYNVSFNLWWQYCNEKQYDFFDCSVSNILDFLSIQYAKGASYGSLNSHRSALSLLLGNNVGSDDRVTRFFKGVFKLRPNFPKYTSTWDPQMVLNHISDWYPNRDLTRERLTKKLVVLLALCTAQRIQTLSLIKIGNISVSSNGINIAIKDIIKTSGIGREQPTLFLPYYRENPRICPATTLEDYIHATSSDRSAETSSLLITVKRPYKGATAQSISRWTKQALSESGVDVAAYSAHSTRHASTSAAAASGLSIDAIRKAAGWTSTSEVFAKFYHRPIINDNNFAKSVLNSVTLSD